MKLNQCISLELLTLFGKRKKIYIYTAVIITESANTKVRTSSKKSGVIKKVHAHKQTMMRLFEFLTFYYSFLLLMVFFLKEAVHQRAFCSYIDFFTEENTVQPFFFFVLLKTISGGVSSTHIIPYSMIICFQCQAQERTHDQCVNVLVVHIAHFKPEGGFDRFVIQYYSK